MFNTSNTIKVFIGNNVTYDATSVEDLVSGEIMILDAEDTIPAGGANTLAALNETQYIRFAANAGGVIHYSPKIYAGCVTALTALNVAAANEQVTHAGYNGTSGAVTVTNYNLYALRITYNHDTGMWSEQKNTRYYEYTTGASDTQYSILNSLIGKVNADAYTGVSATMISNATTVASSGGTWGVTNGSATVTNLSTGADGGFYNADATQLVVGDFIRFGHATTTTFPVYRIVGYSGGGAATATITLDRPYEGTTNATLAAASVGCMTSATGLAGNFGAVFTGEALTYGASGIRPYNKVTFEVTLSGFGSTPVTYTTVASRGNGTYEQVADLEWFALGGDGLNNRMLHPVPTGRTQVNSTLTYDTVCIEYVNSQDTKPISGNAPSRGLIYLFFDQANAGTAANVFIDSLQAWSGVICRDINGAHVTIA